MSLSTILLAGGEGSRLGLDIPKALLPFSPIKKKTLIQYKLELCKAQDADALIGIVVSKKGQQAIGAHLKANGYFGLEEGRVQFLIQKEVPYLLDGEQFFSEEGVIASAPNGNGGIFEAEGFDSFLSAAPDEITITSIDNPLINPFDSRFYEHPEAECIIGVCESIGGDKVGTVSADGDIFDYTESEGVYEHANLGAYRFSKKVLEDIRSKQPLEFHDIVKVTKKYDPTSGEIVQIEAMKQEKFITDVPRFCRGKKLAHFDRKTSFAPIKSQEDVERVQKQVLAQDKDLLLRAGLTVSGDVELHPACRFHAPEELFARFSPKQPLSGYYELD